IVSKRPRAAVVVPGGKGFAWMEVDVAITARQFKLGFQPAWGFIRSGTGRREGVRIRFGCSWQREKGPRSRRGKGRVPIVGILVWRGALARELCIVLGVLALLSKARRCQDRAHPHCQTQPAHCSPPQTHLHKCIDDLRVRSVPPHLSNERPRQSLLTCLAATLDPNGDTFSRAPGRPEVYFTRSSKARSTSVMETSPFPQAFPLFWERSSPRPIWFAVKIAQP